MTLNFSPLPDGFWFANLSKTVFMSRGKDVYKEKLLVDVPVTSHVIRFSGYIQLQHEILDGKRLMMWSLPLVTHKFISAELLKNITHCLIAYL